MKMWNRYGSRIGCDWTDHQLKVFAAAHHGRLAISPGHRLAGNAITLDLPEPPRGIGRRLAGWAVFLGACVAMFAWGAWGRP